MTKLLDLPIGETFDYNGTKLKVVEETRETLHCSGCYFNYSHEGCSSYLCSSGMREDGKKVIFKAVPLESELKDTVGNYKDRAEGLKMMVVNVEYPGKKYVFSAGSLRIEWEIPPEGTLEKSLWTLEASWPNVRESIELERVADVETLRKEIIALIKTFVAKELEKKMSELAKGTKKKRKNRKRNNER